MTSITDDCYECHSPEEPRLVHRLFEEQSAHAGETPAVEHERTTLTYAELNRRANQLARLLIDRGVGPDKVVGIYLEHSLDLIIGALAILKAGGAYLLLDPKNPSARLHYILDDAQPGLILTREGLRDVLSSTTINVLSLHLKADDPEDWSDDNLDVDEVALSDKNLAYVSYTENSKGFPKGTATAHHSMVNLLQWYCKQSVSRKGNRVLQFTALSLDVTLQDTLSTLCCGGTLSLYETGSQDGTAWMDFLSVGSINRIYVPALMLKMLAERAELESVVFPDDLTDVVIVGDQLRISPNIASFFGRLPDGRLHKRYGPGEANVVTALTLGGDSSGWPSLSSIGTPIDSVKIHVLDQRLHPLPVGVIGEIFIGGAHVARGYLNRPALTAERFVADPFSSAPSARMYRTGDLGRWGTDQSVEYRGRSDDQIWIRGYRVESSEIELQLERHHGVRQAVVTDRDDSPGKKRLVAYLSLREGCDINLDELILSLRSRFPDFMVPTAFIVVDQFPTRSNGEVNRRALPAVDGELQVGNVNEALKGGTERFLAETWKELLRLEQVGPEDNFFDLGADSLTTMRLVVRIADRYAIRLQAHVVFRNPTLQAMAETIEQMVADHDERRRGQSTQSPNDCPTKQSGAVPI